MAAGASWPLIREPLLIELLLDRPIHSAGSAKFQAAVASGAIGIDIGTDFEYGAVEVASQPGSAMFQAQPVNSTEETGGAATRRSHNEVCDWEPSRQDGGHVINRAGAHVDHLHRHLADGRLDIAVVIPLKDAQTIAAAPHQQITCGDAEQSSGHYDYLSGRKCALEFVSVTRAASNIQMSAPEQKLTTRQRIATRGRCDGDAPQRCSRLLPLQPKDPWRA